MRQIRTPGKTVKEPKQGTVIRGLEDWNTPDVIKVIHRVKDASECLNDVIWLCEMPISIFRNEFPIKMSMYISGRPAVSC